MTAEADSVTAPPGQASRRKDIVGWAQVIVAVGAALVAFVAAIYTGLQVGQAKQQNTVSEQQALVSLISGIARDPETIDQENGAFGTAGLATSNSALVGTEFTELTDSEEAATLIGLLHGHGVTAIEYYETAEGLEASESDERAMYMFGMAIKTARGNLDPRTLSNAWLALAGIAYHAGDDAKYDSDMAAAQNAYSSKLGASIAEYDRNVAYLRLVDASLRANAGGCPQALAEMSSAETLISSFRNPSGPSKADTLLEKEIKSHCG